MIQFAEYFADGLVQPPTIDYSYRNMSRWPTWKSSNHYFCKNRRKDPGFWVGFLCGPTSKIWGVFPRKLTWKTWKSPLWKGKSSSNPFIFRFPAVSFRWCFFCWSFGKVPGSISQANPKIQWDFWYQDRIHLKPTHYAYAQYLEALEDVEGALTHYEYLGFQTTLFFLWTGRFSRYWVVEWFWNEFYDGQITNTMIIWGNLVFYFLSTIWSKSYLKHFR